MKLRSQHWFDSPDNSGMTALCIERYLNSGITREELQSGSDLSPCNRHQIALTKQVRDGICFGFAVHAVQETGKRPTASLARDLAYPGLVEVIRSYDAPRRGAVI